MIKQINLLFSGTSDYIPLAVVTALSAKENLNSDYKLKIYYLHADIVKEISEDEKTNIIETAMDSLNDYDIAYEFIDISEKVDMLDGQNIGMWGNKVSLTHYFYLLAPEFIKQIDKVLYIDTDIIVNCDLAEIDKIDIKDNLIAMSAPRGFEEMGNNVCNAGFVLINLEQWRKENVLNNLLEFGRGLPKSRFCAQNLLHQYFTLQNPNRLYLLPKEYNIFPQLFKDIPLENIKVLHFTGYHHVKPWNDIYAEQRAGFLWWKYAKKTAFYEQFVLRQNLELIKNVTNKIELPKNSFIENIFSLKNTKNKKIITILGLKIKINRKVKKWLNQF